jgi:competence protein ComEC
MITDVIALPIGEHLSETDDNSVAILLTYGTARVLLAGDAEGREEEYMASGPYTRP